jgi:hypothetical protein
MISTSLEDSADNFKKEEKKNFHSAKLENPINDDLINANIKLLEIRNNDFE